MMKKAMLFFMISSAGYYGCTDHGPSFDKPEIGAPTIGYSPIDSVLGYNRQVRLDLDSDGKPDIYFTSVLMMENGESGLYLQVRAVGGTGTRIMTAKNPQFAGNSRWAYPLAKGAAIGEVTDVNAVWGDPAQNAVMLKIFEESAQPAFSGPWLDNGDHYVAFRKITKGQEQFGWVRASREPGTQTIKIHDMGMNLVPGTAISAGMRNP